MSRPTCSRAILMTLWLTAGVIGCGGGGASAPKGGVGGVDETGGASGEGGSGGKAGSGGKGGSGGGGALAPGGNGGGGAGGVRADSGAPDAATGAGGNRDAGASDLSSGGEPNLAALDKACTPKFTLKLMDTGPKGQLFVEAMGGSAQAVEQAVLQIGRDVCRVLYRKPEEVRPANEMELQIRDYDGVAAKWGDIGQIGVEISTRHIQNVKNEGRDVAAEIKGILYHEMTHMYQNDDKPEGKWAGLAAYYEAGADAVRIRYGLAPAGCRPDKQGTWSEHSYCSGGWWWLWVDTKYPDFIYKLNLQMKGRDGKAWTPADATSIAGKTLDELWVEYQAAACCRGSTTSCCK